MSGSDNIPEAARPFMPAAVIEQAELRAIQAQRLAHAGNPVVAEALAKAAAAKAESAAEAERMAAEAPPAPTPPEALPAWALPGDVGIERKAFAEAVSAMGGNADFFLALAERAPRARGAQAEPEVAKLKAAWGADYDRRLAIVRAEVKRGGPALVAWLERSGAGNDAGLSMLLYGNAIRNRRA
jgi:hypothetical protein